MTLEVLISFGTTFINFRVINGKRRHQPPEEEEVWTELEETVLRFATHELVRKSWLVESALVSPLVMLILQVTSSADVKHSRPLRTLALYSNHSETKQSIHNNPSKYIHLKLPQKRARTH